MRGGRYSFFITPAKAGAQRPMLKVRELDSGLRGNDEIIGGQP